MVLIRGFLQEATTEAERRGKELMHLVQELCCHNSEVTKLVLMNIQWYTLVALPNCHRAENKGANMMVIVFFFFLLQLNKLHACNCSSSTRIFPSIFDISRKNKVLKYMYFFPVISIYLPFMLNLYQTHFIHTYIFIYTYILLICQFYFI